MGYFPFFMEVEGKQCVIVGGGAVAYRKVCDLLPFGVRLCVIAPAFYPDFDRLMEVRDSGQLRLIQRAFEEGDLDGADFVIGASSDSRLNRQISEFCRKNRIPVNVVDVKEECSFIFPALVREGPVTIGISTGGSSPVLARILKQEIRQTLPDAVGELAAWLGSLRTLIRERFPGSEQAGFRGEVLTELTMQGLKAGRPLTEQELEELLLRMRKGSNDYQ